MVSFKTIIHKFSKKGEKTGWTYIEIAPDIAQELKPGMKKSFRVKGLLDDYIITRVALLPMGDGSFIMPLNATIRKGIRKKEGAMLSVKLQVDETVLTLDQDLLICLEDEPIAINEFNKLPPSHKNYFSNWVNSAKTEPTK